MAERAAMVASIRFPFLYGISEVPGFGAEITQLGVTQKGNSALLPYSSSEELPTTDIAPSERGTVSDEFNSVRAPVAHRVISGSVDGI